MAEKVQTEKTNDFHKKKAELRKRILKNRDTLLQEQRQMWDALILKRLIEYDKENPCPVYLCYASFKSEVSTKEFILWCLDKGKTVFVPKVLTPPEMEFYRITAWEDLRSGFRGIPEPEASAERSFSRWLTEPERKTAEKTDKRRLRMLLPGAVFDRNGNRIGYGGGFYDRWLAKWNHFDSGGPAVLEKIGLAYGMQITESAPSESFDQKTDLVITEKDI